MSIKETVKAVPLVLESLGSDCILFKILIILSVLCRKDEGYEWAIIL